MAAEPLTREQIISAAEEALRRYGPGKTNVVDVAQSLGVSHGSVYRHFPTKAALRAAVVRQGLEAVARELRHITEDASSPASDRLHRWLLALSEIKRRKAIDDPGLFGTYAMIENDGPEVIREHFEMMTSQIDRILADGVEAGEFRESVLEGAALAIWDATVRFHHPAHQREWSDPGIGAQFEGVWKLLLDGLAT